MFGATKIEMQILELLSGGKKLYGLEMVKASGDSLKRGTIYVYLGRMEEKEWVKGESEKDPTVPGLPRKRYWITGKGSAVFNRARDTEAKFAAWGEGLAT